MCLCIFCLFSIGPVLTEIPEPGLKLCMEHQLTPFYFFIAGDTAVVTAVYGPVEAKPQRILIDKASVEAIYRPKSGLPC